MRAAVLKKFKAPLELEERARPVPTGEQVLVRVLGAGVCHSDLHISEGAYPELPLPLIIGHEIAGEVEGIGPVLVYANWGEGKCRFCQQGEEQLCQAVTEAGWLKDGGYAEYVLVPSPRYLFGLEGLDPVKAAPLADAGLTSYRAVKRLKSWLPPQQSAATVVVLGTGGLGQFAIQFLKLLTPARVIAVDVSETKRQRALELGADEVASPKDLSAVSARAVLDLVGSDETLALATTIVEKTGIVMQVGEAGGKMNFGLGFVPHEAHFTTSISGSLPDLADVLNFARRGEIQWQVETLPLEQANLALARLKQGQVAGRLILIPG
jgi:propanol-preferring alcohol dehydrogenase